MIPIFDGHNDTLLDLYKPGKERKRGFLHKSTQGHIDLMRAQEGGLIGGIFSIYVPNQNINLERDSKPRLQFTSKGYEVKMNPPIGYQYAKNFTNSIIQNLYNIEKQANGMIKIIRNYNEITNSIIQNKFSIVLHFEGADAIRKDLVDLETYYEKGLRALGIVWSRPNAFGYGVPFKFPHTPDIGPGLTSNGKNLVKKCNELGIMIDLAHLNEKGFMDVAKLSSVPLVVSHTGVFKICKSTRNITDKEIDIIGDSDGIIGIYFDPINLLPSSIPDKNMRLSIIMDHIDYIVKRIGLNHVGFGSDFDGAEMPNSIKDVSYFPNLINILKDRGYTKTSLEKIAYKNWFRIFKETWK
jgi:membrane dipeptidase